MIIIGSRTDKKLDACHLNEEITLTIIEPVPNSTKNNEDIYILSEIF